MKQAAAASANPLLRQAREQRNLSRAEVARHIDTNPFTVYRWERGVTRPSAYFRRRLCALFAMTPAELGFMPPASPESRTPPSPAPRVFLPPPSQMTALWGRDADLQAICDLLRPCGDVALSPTVALHGLPGVGKTTLACVTVHALCVDFPDDLL
jgi:DNA-binding XRE family transcriptional regulator